MIPMFFSVNNSAFKWIKRLIWFYVILFVFTKIVSVWFGTQFIASCLCLLPHSFVNFQWWRFLTYSFLHADFWHIFCNLLLFYGLCKFLLTYETSLKFLLSIYTLGILVGGIFWSIVHIHQPFHSLIGASAGIATLLTYFCLLYPEKSLSILLFFIFPIQIKARWCFAILLVYEIINCLCYETQNMTFIAHSAHLGGILIGALAVFIQKKKEEPSIHSSKTTKNKYKVHIEEDEHIITELPFHLLKKLQEEGLGSLSAEEKRWLEKCRKL